jgi:hypothetical protein
MPDAVRLPWTHLNFAAPFSPLCTRAEEEYAQKRTWVPRLSVNRFPQSLDPSRDRT